jgi:hypothetical protein
MLTIALMDSIVRQLASQLDLNTLHDLSRTCRQFRANLLEYRYQLVKHTLHCCNEEDEATTKLDSRTEPQFSLSASRTLTSGRIGKCARDMVGECQRCGIVVCRVRSRCLRIVVQKALTCTELHHEASSHAHYSSAPSATVSHMQQSTTSTSPGCIQAALPVFRLIFAPWVATVTRS